MASVRVNIKPEILTWAVTRMGVDLEEYSSKDKSFAKWISGKTQPTFTQAQDFAKKFLVPFGFLFLDEPPIEHIPIPYFRKRKGGEQGVYINKTIHILKHRQEWLSEYLQEIGESPKEYVGQYKNIDDYSKLAVAMRGVLGFTEDWTLNLKDEHEAIRVLTDKLEDVGVNVCFSSVLGNSTKRHFGFCLVDDYAPFVFVNSGDVGVAKFFTLAHEFAHVLKGYSAGYGGDENSDDDLERLCNKAASDFLVPTNLFAGMWSKFQYDYKKIAKKFKVSKYVIAIKARDCQYIDQKRLDALLDDWNNEPKDIASKSGGHADTYRVMLRRVGRYFFIRLDNALHENKVLYTDAYRLAGMKGDTFHTIVDKKIALS